MFADRPDDDDAHARVFVERFEHQPQLVALRHRDDVVGRSVEDDVGALMRLIELDLEAVELGEPPIFENIGNGHFISFSLSYQVASEGGACSRW
jgi:hypothetical protein